MSYSTVHRQFRVILREQNEPLVAVCCRFIQCGERYNIHEWPVFSTESTVSSDIGSMTPKYPSRDVFSSELLCVFTILYLKFIRSEISVHNHVRRFTRICFMCSFFPFSFLLGGFHLVH